MIFMGKTRFILVVCGFLFSCVSEPDLNTLVQKMAVFTNYGEDVPFGSYKTFVIRNDTLGFVSNRFDGEVLTGSYPEAVVNTIIDNLTERGYTEVDAESDPDFGVYAYVLDNFSVSQQVVYPSYYTGSYYGYGYYGYYYPYVQTYVSDYGTLVIELVDLTGTFGSNLRVLWNSYIGDLYTTPDLEGNTLEAVNQAFEQSPYLISTE